MSSAPNGGWMVSMWICLCMLPSAMDTPHFTPLLGTATLHKRTATWIVAPPTMSNSSCHVRWRLFPHHFVPLRALDLLFVEQGSVQEMGFKEMQHLFVAHSE